MRLDPRVDHQRPATPPMLAYDRSTNSVNISGRVASREGNPKPIPERPSSEVAVVNQRDQRETVQS